MEGRTLLGEQRLLPSPTPTFKIFYLSVPLCGELGKPTLLSGRGGRVGSRGYPWHQFLGRAVPRGLLLWSGELEYSAPSQHTSPSLACAILPGTWALRCHPKVGRSQRTRVGGVDLWLVQHHLLSTGEQAKAFVHKGSERAQQSWRCIEIHLPGSHPLRWAMNGLLLALSHQLVFSGPRPPPHPDPHSDVLRETDSA